MADGAAPLTGWATVTELARLRGVNKSAISKRVARLESLGVLHPKPGPKRTKLISLAEFDRATAETVDAVRELNGRAAQAAASPSDPILAREQARRASIAADLAQLDLDERLDMLVPVDGVRRAAADCAIRLRQVVEQMHARAEEVAGELARNGSAFAQKLVEAARLDSLGARAFFKALARDHLSELARMATAVEGDWRESTELPDDDRQTAAVETALD